MKVTNSIKRMLRYGYLKMVKEKGSPDYIARGWSIGVAANWILPIGQMPLAFALAIPLRGSKVGALLGTMLTNPLTTIFLYPFQCYIGNLIIGGGLSFSYFRQALLTVIEDKSWETTLEALRSTSGTVIASFLVGGVVYLLLTVPLTYFLTRFLVIRFRRIRAKRQELKRLQQKDEDSGNNGNSAN